MPRRTKATNILNSATDQEELLLVPGTLFRRLGRWESGALSPQHGVVKSKNREYADNARFYCIVHVHRSTPQRFDRPNMGEPVLGVFIPLRWYEIV